ncbi:MAG: nucleotidyltransferase family protein [Symploca sp. SIO2G7]|nr:nucleotidyltransferase family protein [Symploca sp. SIO2G7]
MTTQIQTVAQERLQVPLSQIISFCDRWKIIEFSLFGSVLRDDFHLDSDIDILYQFAPNHGWNLFDIVHMKEELEQMFARKVDFVSKQSLQNPYRRYEILRTHQVIYRHEQP